MIFPFDYVIENVGYVNPNNQQNLELVVSTEDSNLSSCKVDMTS